MRLLGALIVLLIPTAAHAEACGAAVDTARAVLQLTPITLRVLQAELTPVPGSDGKMHVAYAAQMTNLDHRDARIATIDVVDPARDFAATGESGVVNAEGRPITSRVRLFKTPPGAGPQADSTVLPGGASGIVFFDVRYAQAAEVPRALAHRIRMRLSDDTLTELTNPVPVACRPPVVLSPPLAGGGWWNGNGCCEAVGPHRGATLPINGTINAPEQFAIDFAQLRGGGESCCTGPLKDLSSWPFYGAPVTASADGTVVEIERDMPEQVPGSPEGVTAANAAGNHVIENIGDGRYVLYAHLRAASIPDDIVAGSKLSRGQRIGGVGNTGSSTAPHLHFQVMDRPSALDATGLPFVFDAMRWEGTVAGALDEADNAYEAGQAIRYAARDRPEPLHGLMPLEGGVFGFGGPGGR